MASNNTQDIQYQILQEAHETASQLSASQDQGLGLTVVEVPLSDSQGNDVESGTDNVVTTKAESPAVTMVEKTSLQQFQSFAPQGVTVGTQIFTTSGQVVTVQASDIGRISNLVMSQDIKTDSGDIVTVPVPQEVGSQPQEVTAVQQIETSPGNQVEISNQDHLDIGEVMMCLVCGDRGSGYHYSVFSCEGCKGFFKRTVQKNLAYTCKDDQNCAVNKFTRNSCQFCRFKKCLEHGMKREAVREDRTPGGKHRHKRLRTEESLVLPNEAVDEEMLAKLVDSRPDLTPTTDDVTCGPDGIPQLDVNSLMQYGYMELRLIIEWARKVPGFSELLIEDQMALLKSSFMELNVLRLAFRSLVHDGLVKFAEGIVMSPEACQQLGWGKDLVTCTLEFVSRIREINIDNSEFCILNAVVLTYPDAAGVQDKEAVINLQSKILDTFRKYSINRYPTEPRRYGKMLLRLPSLRTISAIAAERFLSMSLDGSVKMNALVLEMMS